VTGKRTKARQKLEFGRRSFTSHQPLSEPDDLNYRHHDQNLCSPARVCPDHSCLVVGIPPFPRIWVGDLARRLIPWTAALLAGGFRLRAAKLC